MQALSFQQKIIMAKCKFVKVAHLAQNMGKLSEQKEQPREVKDSITFDALKCNAVPAGDVRVLMRSFSGDKEVRF